jgi:excinuclease ABC subunit A
MIARKDAQEGAIRIRGLRQNNLRSVDCDLPLGRFIAVTGVSGSGKSSFAFDALYGEGQRRYIETFSSYTRQFLDRMARPDADAIENIPPAIAIDQSGAIKTSRSTVGTLTGINDYLKLLFARASTGFCPQCGRAVEPEGTSAVLAFLAGLPPEAFPALITALVPLGGFDSSEAIARALAAQGFLRFLRGGDVVRIEDLGLTDVQSPALEVVVDRIASPHATRSRRADSLELAFRAGKGAVAVRAGGASRTFTSDLRCGDCGTRLAAPTPGLFSFNNPYGACTRCRGFGRIIEIDPRRVVPDPSLTIAEGAIKPFTGASARHIWRRCLRFCAEQKIPVDVPYERLSDPQRKLVQEGGPGFGGVKAFFRRLEERKYKLHVRVFLSRYRGYETCPDCLGGRLRPEAFYFRLAGKTIREVWDASIRDLRRFIAEVESSELPKPVRLVAGEVASRLGYLDSVGLGYLTLGRQARTLSGGEVERVNLTSALGASLVNTLFVLDEPSIGLHARDNARLIEILREVSSRGNTVVVVEHDPEILQAVEHVIDIGPEAGAAGGRIVAEGTLEAVAASSESITGAYLAGRKCIPRRTARRAPKSGRSIRVRGARENNLQRLDVDLPLDVFVVVSGVSGSGKSTLIEDVVWRAYRRRAGEAVDGDVNADRVDGFDLVSAAVLVDQSPLGRTPRGNTATYMKVFEAIRKLFGASSGARQAGLTARDFSFNAEGGRCPECGGAGATQIEMQFLSDVTLPCESCGGKRFQERVLQVRLRAKSIDDVLSLTVREAMDFFAAEPDLLEKLSFLDALGLGYLRLGQPLNTLSGGEAQRLKLASRVQASRRERLLFLLDEPTTGLHLDDVGKLLEVLHGLVDAGHSVVVIEHHLDVIAAADWVVDLGPEGGAEGGRRLDAGTPEDVAARCASTGSITGAWLQKHLDAGSPGRPRPSQTSKRPGIARPAALDSGAVRVVGARENNLKDITVSIPRDQLVVVTGLSGAGKSSLLHDIVFAEGQRRYLDCMSPYARQFVEELRRPDIDHLEGIPPAVAIEQRTTVGGRKSTVGTVTEVYQFLRLLYARGGVQFCPECDVEVAPAERGRHRRRRSTGSRAAGAASWLRRSAARKVSTRASSCRRGGMACWTRASTATGSRSPRIGRFASIGTAPTTSTSCCGVSARVGARLLICGRRSPWASRWAAASSGSSPTRGKETVLSLHRSCPSCGRDFEEPDPRNFSFHSWHGACEACNGYGSVFDVDPEKLIDRWDVPAEARPDGPLAFLEESPFGRRDRKRFLQAAAAAVAAPWEEPLSSWPRRALKILIEGDAARGFPGLRGFVGAALEGLEEDDRELHWARWGIEKPCELCGGGRLQREWLSVRVASRGIAELTRLPIAELRTVAQGLELSARARAVCGPVLEGILSRLEFLEQVGLGYLTLDRAASTLSTGESQRIRLAAQLGSSLRGVAYILDEPTIGLHPRTARGSSRSSGACATPGIAYSSWSTTRTRSRARTT